MFDIGFSELILVFVIGLVVLGPQRLPVAVKTVVGWIRALRSLAANVQNELAQELKLQELQDSLKKVEEASKNSLTPELKASMEELKQTAESMKRSYLGENEKADDEANTIHNPLVKNAESHDGVTPAAADHQASAPVQAPAASAAVTAAQPAVTAAQPAAETVAPVVHVSSAASEPVAPSSAVTEANEPPAAASAPYEPGVAAAPNVVTDAKGVINASEAGAAKPAAAKAKPGVTEEALPLSSRAPVSTTQPDER